MNKLAIAAAATLMMTGAAYAASDDATENAAPTGDVAAGEEAFNRQCITCHVVKNEDGEVIAGRNARTGPNLYNIIGNTVAHDEEFKYSKAFDTAREEGVEWDEENFAGYVQDPTGWLRDTVDDKKARGKMSYKVRKEEDAHDLYAYLHSLAPADADGEEAKSD